MYPTNKTADARLTSSARREATSSLRQRALALPPSRAPRVLCCLRFSFCVLPSRRRSLGLGLACDASLCCVVCACPLRAFGRGVCRLSPVAVPAAHAPVPCAVCPHSLFCV
eukprot:7023454-Prymnesium_polylepis.2